MDPVEIVPMFFDNYLFFINYDQDFVAVVDPGDAALTIKTLKENNWTLTHILATHDHLDHIGGVPALKDQTDCTFIGIHNYQNLELPLTLGKYEVDIIPTPGHTKMAITYYFKPIHLDGPCFLMVGDTVFKGGCGRIFTGTAGELYDSIEVLKTFPNDTLVYPAHEYTLDNYYFYESIDPKNQMVHEMIEETKSIRSLGNPSIPTTIGIEKEKNPFFNCHSIDLKQALNLGPDTSTKKTFKILRERKDRF